jgi:hypothetical protein
MNAAGIRPKIQSTSNNRDPTVAIGGTGRADHGTSQGQV